MQDVKELITTYFYRPFFFFFFQFRHHVLGAKCACSICCCFCFHFVLMRMVLCQFVISSVTILRTVQISAGVRTYMGVLICF